MKITNMNGIQENILEKQVKCLHIVQPKSDLHSPSI